MYQYHVHVLSSQYHTCTCTSVALHFVFVFFLGGGGGGVLFVKVTCTVVVYNLWFQQMWICSTGHNLGHSCLHTWVPHIHVHVNVFCWLLPRVEIIG